MRVRDISVLADFCSRVSSFPFGFFVGYTTVTLSALYPWYPVSC